MTMRVIAGSAKGKRLKLVPGDTTRPIMDRVKESLFNILGRRIFDANFCDLFAGTGSVGIEALSRGADTAYFYDLTPAAIDTIKANLAYTKLASRAVVRRADAFSLLNESPPIRFDFIYVAPPQYRGMWVKTLECLEANPAWIPEGTDVIVQIDPTEWAEVPLKYLSVYDERRYGNTLLWFLERPTSSEDSA